MSIYLLLESLIDEIEKMINSFWWDGGNNNNKGIRWLAWEKLACIPQGGRRTRILKFSKFQHDNGRKTRVESYDQTKYLIW
jgi:hypothetical protein